MPVIRAACWREEALEIAYTDRDGAATRRTILPLSIVYTEASLAILAWCRLREDFRIFMIARVSDVQPTGESFRPRRASLLRDYLARLAD